jgi:hypothetical protein
VAESPPRYLFSTFPGFEGRKPPIGVGDGNGAGRGAVNGAAVGTGRGATGWVGQGAAGAAAGVGDAGIGRGAGAVNGAGDTGFSAGAIATAGLIATVFAFTLACLPTFLIAFLADFFATTRFLALFLTADCPFFLRIKIARFVFFDFVFACFALLLDFLAMIAS